MDRRGLKEKISSFSPQSPLIFSWFGCHQINPKMRQDYRAVWFVPKCATLCLRLVVRIEELTLGRKVRQSVTT
jgi:hypothetical protein